MAKVNNIDFLRFSAYSFKDLITRKMSENTKFTDQVYEGSNLAILIDLCAYLFQGLTYCINSAASESLFSDTQIYTNINRLVKLIGYNPKGFIPSTCQFVMMNPGENDDLTIPRYTALKVEGKTDTQGNPIYYSFIKDQELANGKTLFKLYNGKWKMYNTVFTSSGAKYETFVLTSVKSNSDEQKYVAYGHIHVYVKRNGKFLHEPDFTGLTDEIFLNTSTKYDGSDDTITVYKSTDQDRYFSIRLNENKEYEIKFGNDNNGQKLQKDDQIYVFYLESNGFDAKLNIGDVSNGTLIPPTEILGLNDDMFYFNILNVQNLDKIENMKKAIIDVKGITNSTASTEAQGEETVEDIRSVAPDFYKLGNRLVTKSDFEYYVKNRYKDNIIDVKCQNNWDYISTFYGWLYNLGKNGVKTEYKTENLQAHASDPQYYINKAKLVKYDYFYADPADENNVYLWAKMQNNSDQWKQDLDESLNSIKVLTSETVFVDPITVQFMICAAPIQRVIEYFSSDQIFDSKIESYLEITINEDQLYSNTSIKMQINDIFSTYFRQLDLKLGQIIDVNEIEKRIYAINGIERIRTVFSSNEVDDFGIKKYKDRFIDGISMASWSSDLIDIGDDLVVGTTTRTLEPFQFPKFYKKDIMNNIVVIKRSFSNNSTVQY